jgi:regulatory protein
MEKTITNLETQKKNPNRVNVFLDDEFAFGISRFVGLDLKLGEKIDDSMVEKLLENDGREKALQKALRFINYRSRTSFEVKEKLIGLGFENDIVDSILNELIEKKYINDREFAENWVSSRCHSKPRSHRMVQYELRKKSIPEAFIQEALNSMPNDDELAIALGKKNLHRFAGLDEKIFTKKMTGILARRAFSFSVVHDAIIKLNILRNESG